MARSELGKSYVYRFGLESLVELPEDPVEDDLRSGGDHPLWSPEWYEALGYYPRPSVFGTRLGGAYVEVYTQSADSDAAPYTFMCRVGLAGTLQNVFVENLPNLINFLKDLGPAMQTWKLSEQPHQ